MLQYRCSTMSYGYTLMKGARYFSEHKKLCFYPNYRLLKKLPGVFSAEQIQTEQRFSVASPYLARMHGGLIMKQFLDAIPTAYIEKTKALGMLNTIDCRVHYLKPGDYPAQPGWHCDGSSHARNMSYGDNHQTHVHDFIMCTFSDDAHGVSNTQFLKHKFMFFGKQPQSNDLHVWDDLNQAIEHKQPDIYTNHDGQMIEFDAMTPHRAQKATRPGWRMFVRMSMWPNSLSHDEGELTSTNHIYPSPPQDGSPSI